MIDQLQAFALMGAFSAGMTREEIETEFKFDCADLDEKDAEKLRNIAVTLAAAILSKKS